MATTTDELWSWNGTLLNQPYWNIGTVGGSRFSLPALRGQDIPVPFQAGQQYRKKFPDSRVITLVMWAAGIDQTTGNPAADQRLAWNNNYQQIRAIFWTRDMNGSVQGSLSRSWYTSQQGSPALITATALGEIAGTMEPTMTGRTRSDFSVDILLADPYFYGVPQNQTCVYNTNTAITNFGEGVAGEGAQSSFTVKLNGPLTNPTLTNQTAGASVTFTGTIATGSTNAVTLDIVNYTAFTGAGANVSAKVTHAGARRWMGLLPAANTLKLTSTNGADTGTAVVTWNPPYL